MKSLRTQALILDDSPVLARHLQLLLGRLGIGAEVCAEATAEAGGEMGSETGSEMGRDLGADAGAETAIPAEVDVIFVEVLQACGNGFQLLRELARTRACPLVLLTGTGRASDRHWGLQAGAAAVLRRPVDEAALRACLQELGLLPAAVVARRQGLSESGVG